MAAGRGAGEEKLASKSVISVTVILVTDFGDSAFNYACS
jgi:hypothetical protein